jgi:hypothetical protein
VREQQPILKKLKLLFLFNPLTEWIDTTHLMRLWAHDRSVKAGKYSIAIREVAHTGPMADAHAQAKPKQPEIPQTRSKASLTSTTST